MGLDFACAQTATSVSCWGHNDLGQTGQDITNEFRYPRSVVNLDGPKVIDFHSGRYHSCAVMDTTDPDQSVVCWGSNVNDKITSQLGSPLDKAHYSPGLPAVHDGAMTDPPTRTPTQFPTQFPTNLPTKNPTVQPTNSPTLRPTTSLPSQNPTVSPTRSPTTRPTKSPTVPPTVRPTSSPTTLSPTIPGGTRPPTPPPTDAPTEPPTPQPTATPTDSPTLSPTNAPTGSPVVVLPDVPPCKDVDMKYDHMCAIGSDNLLRCWGKNAYGQTGRDPNVESGEAVTVVSSLGQVLDVAVGKHHTCAIRSTDGAVYCWGSNTARTLGSDVGASHTPQRILTDQANKRFDEVWAGDGNTCARDTDRALFCWGYNQLPRRVDVSLVSKASMRLNGGCAIANETEVYCWGDNDSGQVGDESTTDRDVPAFTGITDAADISCHDAHCCACRSNGVMECWGSNWHGKVGDFSNVFGTRNNFKNTPFPVEDIECRSVHTTRDGTCVVEVGGVIKCWGRNDLGAVGDNSILTPTSPYELPLPPNVLALATGDNTVCAAFDYVKEGSIGGYHCWGSNADGVILGEEGDKALEPVKSEVPFTGRCDSYVQPPTNAPSGAPTGTPTVFVPVVRKEIEHHFEENLGHTCGNSQPTSTTNNVDAVTCQGLCDADDTCLGATFNGQTGACSLHDGVVLETSVSSTCFRKSYLAPQSPYETVPISEGCDEGYSALNDYAYEGSLSECRAYCNSRSDCASFQRSSGVCTFNRLTENAPSRSLPGVCQVKQSTVGAYTDATCGALVSINTADNEHLCLDQCAVSETCYGWRFKDTLCYKYGGEGDVPCQASTRGYDEEAFRVTFVDAVFDNSVHTTVAFKADVRDSFRVSANQEIEILSIYSGSVVIEIANANKETFTNDALRFADTLAARYPDSLGVSAVYSAYVPPLPASTAAPTLVEEDTNAVLIGTLVPVAGILLIGGAYRMRLYKMRPYMSLTKA